MEAIQTSDGAVPAADMPFADQDPHVRDISRLILDIVFEHALNKFDNSQDLLEKREVNFLSVIARFVATQQPVKTCLPAFPFKSANKVYKVLGTLPDKAEELALERLNSMCTRIQKVYPPGAEVTIISDGITYNDLLCISDQDTWAYGQALRKMAVQKQFDHVGFCRIGDLLDSPMPKEMRDIVYIANCTNFRRMLLNEHGKTDLNIDDEIASNPDTKLTYLGYKRFLESDLKHIFPRSADRTSNSYKRDCKYLAKQMLIRGYAFAGAVKSKFPNHLRLSIHESVAGDKVSISLLSTKTGFTTPWHCSVAQLASGQWISAPMGEFSKDDRLRLVYEDGRPSHFEERTPEKDGLGITETTADYLREAKPLSVDEYLSGASTPSTLASSDTTSNPPSSVSSPSLSVGGSAETTPVTDSPPIFASSPIEKPSSVSILSQELDAGDAIPYGRRLIPQIMDSLAVAEPERVVFSLTKLSADSLEFRHISARLFTQAVDKLAWWLHGQVGDSDLIQPVGYIGPHDLRHVLLTYACVKAGYTALFLSPKNNTEGALAVLEATKCSIWAAAGDATTIPLVKDILQQRPMKLLQLPLLDELLDATPTEPYPYSKTFKEAKNDPFCFLHTSGTTGVPKPIPWSHGLVGTMDAVRLLPPVDDPEFDLAPWTSDWKSGDRIYSSFPMSHGAGVIMDIMMPALFDLHCVLGPVGVLPNINLVEKLADTAKIDIWSMVPSLVDELGETPEVLAKFEASKFICASGGPVSPVSTGKVNEVIRVLNLTGTTEGLFIGNLVTAREDWFWFCFHPSSGFEFKQLDDDTYEHWVHRNEDWSLMQGIFHTFPDKDSINFKDLYKRHPTKPNLWAFKGRSDDLVVLSNGYKISPLETEAFVTTHPAISGCLVFGTAKPQAGLLIELKDPSHKPESLLDSIWETVKKANSMSLHKNQLHKDFVTFAEADKPFIRTDKGTIKRPATLALYGDYIERFYSSRSEDCEVNVHVDLTSIDSIQDCIREVLSSSLPEGSDVRPETDLFALGLDSLGVFAAVKTIRAATGLGERIAPRHMYANPTIKSLSETVAKLSEEKQAKEKASPPAPVDQNKATLDAMIAQHKARQTFGLNAFDYVNPNHGMGLMFYLPLREGADFKQVFDNLQAGLNRTFDMIPGLSGKMMHCSEQTIGYTKGDLCVTMPALSMAASAHDRLVYKDLSDVLPSFEKMRDAGFAPSICRDDVMLRDDPFPKFPADIFVGQANFVSGGCIVAVDLNHCCLDGLGVMVAIKAWAENCRFLQGDESATCEWYDPESFNHSLPEIIHEQEGWVRPMEEIDPGTWNFLPFFPPEADENTPAPVAKKEWTLPPRPDYPLHNVWPLPRAERCLRTTLFVITREKLEMMKQEVIADPESKGVITSISDIVQAFFWRAAIRARYRVAKEIRRETFGEDDLSILELPTDGRPFFSSLLPSTYMGSLLVLSRSTMPVETLCSPDTSVGQVAYLLRQAAARITPSVVHDALTILQSLPDHGRFSTANMGLEHMNAMISNMMLFPANEINFGDAFFGNEGSPESMRPLIERGNGRFRFLVVFPLRKDGGVELVLGTHPEELDMFMTDDDFTNEQLVFCGQTAQTMRSPVESHVSARTKVDNDENLSLLSHESHDTDNAEDEALHAADDGVLGGPSSDPQPGVQNIEAVALTWTTGALISVYIMIWLTHFVEGVVAGATMILTPYVTSAFAMHSLTPTVGILSSVVGGVTNLTLAKILDVFGRPHGYLFCIMIATLGLIMMTVCHDIETYAVAQVLGTVGNNGILYSLMVFVADTSSLRNRGLLQAIVSSPNIITCFAAGPIASRFLEGPGWRWAFGVSTIMVPAITLPLFGLLWNNHLRAKRQGLVVKNDADDGRTAWEALQYYCQQFDAVGLILLSAGVALFLLPFNLYTVQGWSPVVIIGMLAAGISMISGFVVWERRCASTTLIPYALLVDGTVAGACLLSATLFLSYFVWNSFFSSYLQVVNDLSVENASYVVQSYTVCSVLCGIAVGTLIHYTGRFKPICLYVGIPLSIVGSAMMMYFCSVGSGVAPVVLCQILISIAAAIIMVCDELAILAAASHQHVAICLAVLGMFGNIGGAIGLTVASAIWQDVFPRKLGEYLPKSELPNLDRIYANISTQLSYPVGSDTRIAIQHAYQDSQMRMLAVGTGMWVVGLVAVMMWRDINVISIKQNKGHVW
ncbi:hypothetical protein ACHAQH_008683 [Verticillium albo-atrum]